jgi:GNAT superfamily N-acetyltransferase
VIHFTIQQGKEINSYIKDIARLRISIFREYPYLYDGNETYEEIYLAKFSEVEDSYVVLVFDDDIVIGAFTGIPMRFENETIVNNLPQDKVQDAYYLSEIILNKNYRGKGIGRQLIHKLEDKIISLKKYKRFYFASVIRPENHPAKPKEYRSLDTMWLSNGYQPTSFTCTLSWKEISEKEETEKILALWEKEIKPN